MLRLEGELDAATAPELERKLTGLPAPGPVLVLDLHELSFLDSLGLNMLFRAREWALTRDVALRLVRAPVHVQRLIVLAAMEATSARSTRTRTRPCARDRGLLGCPNLRVP